MQADRSGSTPRETLLCNTFVILLTLKVTANIGLTKAGARALLGTTAPQRVDASKSTKSVLSLQPHEGPATPADAFVTRYLQESLRLFKGNPKHHAWEDVAFGAIVKRLGLQIAKVAGLYGWQLKPADYVKAVRSCHPLPINFHYVNESAKYRLHTDLRAHGCAGVSAPAFLRTPSSYTLRKS